MSGSGQDNDRTIRERAYFTWERDGRPDGRAYDHWVCACAEEQEHVNEQMYVERAMRAVADCRDVFVTADGTRDAPVQGWITNVNLGR